VLRRRFQQELTSRVRIDYFTQKPSRIYVPGRQDCPLCEDVKTMLEEVASLSDRISLTVHELAESRSAATSLGVDKVPAIVIRGQANRAVRYFGMPSASQFPAFISALSEASTGTAVLEQDSQKLVKKVRSEVHLQVFVTPVSPHCPGLALAALRLGLANPKVRADVVEIGEFPQQAQAYPITAVPTTVLNEKSIIVGEMKEADLARRVLQVVEGRRLAASETRAGASTPFTLQAQQQPAGPRQTGSGLFLPR
jgi:glutaredoxin-like protein